MNKLQKKASQPRAQSFVESVVNVLVGLVINVTAQMIVFPWFGIYIPLQENLEIAAVFTIISIVRSFCLRRAFNRYHIKRI